MAELWRRSWVVAPVASAVVTIVIIAQFGSAAITAAIQRALVDQVGQATMVSLVVVTVVGLALAYAAGAAGNRIQGSLRFLIAERIEFDLSGNVLRWATQAPHLDQYDRPDYLNRLHLVRSNTHKLAGISWNSVQTAAVVLGLAASLVLLSGVNPWLMAMAVLAAPPLLLTGRSGRFIRDAREQVAPLERQEATLNAYVSHPEQAKEIRVSSNQGAIDQRCAALWDQARRILRTAHVRSAIWAYAGWLVFAVGYLGAVGLTIWLVTQQRATIGDLALVISLGQQLRWQVVGVAMGFTEVADAGHIAAHYHWLRRHHDQTSDTTYPDRAPDRLDHGIMIDHLSFTYPGQQRPAVDNLSTHLRAGQVVALLGENGAGKTTLVKLLLGQYQPDHGSITVDGTNLATVKPADWARRCSGLVQDFAKLQGPLREAVSAGAIGHLDRAGIRTAIDQAHATAMVDQLPRGIDNQLGLAFGTRDLSHGQWQRLALARGLTRNTPLLLVLDEPTSALDPEVEHHLFDAFFRRARAVAASHGTIALIVSHRLSTTQHADLILVMDHGNIVEAGNHSTLMAHRGPYSELYQLQRRAYH